MSGNEAKFPASVWIADHLAACLPPGTPPNYRSMSKARYVGTGRRRMAIAELVMFDGLPATVEVFKHGHGFGHRWLAMEGGDASFEDGRWQRVDRAA